jgi:subtilisin family serine protease
MYNGGTMKRIITVVMMLVLSMALLAENNDFWPKRVIVQLSSVNSVEFTKTEGLNSGINALDQLGKEIKVNNFKPLFENTRDQFSQEHGLNQFYVLDYSSDQAERSVIEKLEKIDNVLTAELDEKYELYYTPTDSLVSNQWYLTKTETDEAWDTQQGADGVVLAIVDTGVKITHRDLRQAMWNNEAEMNGSAGVDDDGNGKVDDFYGWDFSDGDNSLDHDFVLLPNHGEDPGTHCAGAAAATDHTSQSQNTGIAGVGFGAKIMGVKIFPNSYPSTTSPAIKYAADNGEDFIEMRDREVVAMIAYLQRLGTDIKAK